MAAAPAALEAKANNEVWWIPLEDDPREDIIYYQVRQCEFGNCSKQAWKRSKVWSRLPQDGDDAVRSYYKMHLIEEHNYQEDDADVAASTCDVDVCTETFEEREKAREDDPGLHHICGLLSGYLICQLTAQLLTPAQNVVFRPDTN